MSNNNYEFNRDYHQNINPDNQFSSSTSSLHSARIANRRQREDAWQNEQDKHATEGLLGYHQSNTNNTSDDQNQQHRFRMYDPNQKVVSIGVNREHHAPFLPQPEQEQKHRFDDGDDGDGDFDINNKNLTTQNKHRALVWPAKDPNGPLATAAIKGSATVKDHRKKKVQTATVRSRVLAADGDVESASTASTRAANSETRTETNRDTNNNQPENDLDSGNDEDVISASTTNNNNLFRKMQSTSTFEAERERIREQRERLPAFKVRDSFIEKVRDNQVIVIKGETGSGKSTQLPQYLLEAHFASRDGGKSGIIGCTQPRRVAAISLARRVSQEVGTEVGDLVGYAVRLEDVTSANTKLKFMTDGVLLREAVLDPLLWKYNVLVLDEAHERSVDTDVLLGVVKRVLKKRRDFRLVLMSATMQIEKFSDFFGGCEIFEVTGRTFPVHRIYSPSLVEDYVEAAVLQVLNVHVTAASIDQKIEEEAKTTQSKNSDLTSTTTLQPTGDILIFLTGEEDVRCACDLIRQRVSELETEMEHKAQLDLEQCRQTGKPLPKQLKLKKLDVIPCFSTILVNKEQLDRVLNPPENPETTRKCIVATNVAETSLTIDGITVVIDCGFMKCKVFKPKMGAHPLLPFPISQAQATQRAGRAGRTREGTCYHLYTEKAVKTEMLEAPVPEIKRSSIDRVCLFIKAIGIHDVDRFDFIDPPPTEIVHQSLYSLWLLGALDDTGKLTERGRQLAALPVEPAMGTVLLASKDYRCTKECLNIAAMLSVDTRALFAVPRDKEDEARAARDQYVDFKSDHITLHNLLSRFLHEAEVNGGEMGARRWAERTFLSFSVLKTAVGIRDQLQQQVGKLLFSSSSSHQHQHQQSEQDMGALTTTTTTSTTINSDRFQNALEATRFCIVSGFFPHSVKRHKLGEYITILTNVPAQLPPTSALASTTTAEFLVYNELAMTAERSFLSITTVADADWLVEASRGLFFIRGSGQQQNHQHHQQQQQQQQQAPPVPQNSAAPTTSSTTTKPKPKFVPASMRGKK